MIQYCDENSDLFQSIILQQQITNWTSLQIKSECNRKNPHNCVPNSIALAFPAEIPRDQVQQFGFDVESTGANIEQVTNYLEENIKRLKFKPFMNYITQNDKDILFDILSSKLKNGNATVIGLRGFIFKNGNMVWDEGHFVVFAKSLEGEIFLFDGQTERYYIKDKIDEFIRKQNYNVFVYYCSANKKKRKKTLINKESNTKDVVKKENTPKTKKQTQKQKKKKLIQKKREKTRRIVKSPKSKSNSEMSIESNHSEITPNPKRPKHNTIE